MSVCLTVVGLVLVLAVTSLVTADFVGYNVTSSASTNDSHTAIILEGVPLNVDVLKGFYVTMATANCPIILQIWRRNSYMKYSIQFEKEYRSLNSGAVFIPLEYSEQCVTATCDRLGFSSLDDSSSCVAFEETTDQSKQSLTLYHNFNGGIPPAGNSTYTFEHYKNNYIFGFGIDVAYGESVEKEFVYADIHVLGFNVTNTTQAHVGLASVLLEGMMLIKGQVLGYYVTLPTANCPIRLQIWRPVTGHEYTLLGETEFESNTTGDFYVPSSHHLNVTEADRLGFTSLDPQSSCVPFEVNLDHYSQTMFCVYTNLSQVEVNCTFVTLKDNFLFALSVAIREVKLLLPGMTGPTGNMGAAGATGHQGVVGNAGVVGDKGSTGQQGPKGDDGPQGVTEWGGTPVKPGAQPRQQGPQGPPGINGSMGPTGDNGQVGKTGRDGDEGGVGENGTVGLTGPKGETGDAVRGEVGEMGPSGSLGRPGPNGGVGDRGLIGLTGMAGPSGSAGLIGGEGPMWTPVDYCTMFNARCEGGCENDGLQAVCSCAPGFLLVDGNRCLDVDECADRNGLCQYDCVNSVGSFHCECPFGLVLSLDMHRCNDRDECTDISDLCPTGQECVNQWGEYLCVRASPMQDSLMMALTGQMVGMPLVTRHVIIGLLVWLTLLSVLAVVAVILFIQIIHPGKQRTLPNEYVFPRSRQPDFHYPAIFPTISVDRRPSTDKLSIQEPETPRVVGKDKVHPEEFLITPVSKSQKGFNV